MRMPEGIHTTSYAALADRIWAYAELGYEEQRFSSAHIETLEQHGFRVRRGEGGKPARLALWLVVKIWTWDKRLVQLARTFDLPYLVTFH